MQSSSEEAPELWLSLSAKGVPHTSLGQRPMNPQAKRARGLKARSIAA